MSLRVSSKSVWNSKTETLYDIFLYDSQLEVLNQADKNFIYALGTGSGKTYIGLHHYLKWSTEPLLIIAPAAKVKEHGWQKSIEYIEECYGVAIDYDIITWNVLAKRWEEFVGRYVIVDECHTVKNSTSKVGAAIWKLSRKADGICLLSATPMSNGWEDSVNYFKMFGLTPNKTQFNRKYAITEIKQTMANRSYPVVVGWRFEDELITKWQSISIERDASHFVELPTLNEQYVEFSKSSTYKKLEKDRVLELDGVTIGYDTLPKLNAARRKFGNTKDKIEHLKMISDTSENLLIFYNFDSEREALYELFDKTDKSVYEVSGHQFKLPSGDVTNSVTLVQYQAGGAGIELQYASVLVMFSPTYSYQDWIQSIGRAYRPSTHKRLTMYKYKVKGTIDTAIYRSLEQKKDFKESLYREDGET